MLPLVLAVVAVGLFYIPTWLRSKETRNKVSNLHRDVVKLLNEPKVNKLIEEYKALGGTGEVTYAVRRPWGDEIPEVTMELIDTDGRYYVYSIQSFECDVICELRKQKLIQLESKKGKRK